MAPRAARAPGKLIMKVLDKLLKVELKDDERQLGWRQTRDLCVAVSRRCVQVFVDVTSATCSRHATFPA